MKRFTPKRLGIFFSILAVAMLVTELAWKPVFTVQLTESIRVPIWILVAIYAALQLYLHRAMSKHLHLTAAELREWGDTLERVTPTILERIKTEHVRVIAASLQESEGIPPDVTLRYIIALGKHAKEARQGKS